MDDKAADKTAGIVAVVAGRIAAVKLSRVESREIQNRSPRMRFIISSPLRLPAWRSRPAKRRNDLALVKPGI